jgi:hypothetical protein
MAVGTSSEGTSGETGMRVLHEDLYEGQHGFRPGYSCESQVITVCQDIEDSLDNGERVDAIIIDFSKAFDLVPHGRLLTKIANSGGGF